MNMNISVSGAHVTVTIHDFFALSARAKNEILGTVADVDDLYETIETIDRIEDAGYLVVSGDLIEMKELLGVLWNFM